MFIFVLNSGARDLLLVHVGCDPSVCAGSCGSVGIYSHRWVSRPQSFSAQAIISLLPFAPSPSVAGLLRPRSADHGMDFKAFSGTLEAAEALMLESGPCTGLTWRQMVAGCPDAMHNNASVVRGRGPTASAARAYLKLHKAHEELAVALKACEQGPAKPLGKPRNSRVSTALVPLSESLALVPYIKGPR